VEEAEMNRHYVMLFGENEIDMALSKPDTERVWEGLYNSEVRSVYFGYLSGRYQKQQSFMTWVSLFLSGGTAGTFVSKLAVTQPWVPQTLAFLTAGLSLYSVVAKKERRGVDASNLSAKWTQLGMKYDVIFRSPGDYRQVDLTPLEDKRVELSQAAHSLADNRKLMRKSQDNVKKLRRLT
jgi:hypothetical protein